MSSRKIATWWYSNKEYLAKALKEILDQAFSPAPGSAAVTRTRRRMTLEEASDLFGIKKDASLKEILERSDHLYKLNDPSKGGSKYLQAKVLSARLVLEDEARKRGETLPEERNNNTQYHSP
ncbi:hypothetical protein GAYE_SCF04G2476 [Galdieria yellowstonensis]|uniref:Mitochondrial import inner membrane translocase subunit TIM16 n=1 Tax=Galdieria yellowstonensis TaxID=3028027 RepID=A0AAV9I3G1_9RHOD|nr:hypothetical protein GAYE_PCTG36G1019 [Galdieria yellowstonensis]KAK4524575.1 hypothetical protein GAYE_SCF04G2476 [Galdieria yellowstonensis]